MFSRLFSTRHLACASVLAVVIFSGGEVSHQGAEAAGYERGIGNETTTTTSTTKTSTSESLDELANTSDVRWVWEVLEGNCQVASWDSECVSSPTYSGASNGDDSCVVRLLDTRIAEGDNDAEFIVFVGDTNLTLTEGDLQLESGLLSVEGNGTENVTLYWRAAEVRLNSGWQVCARRSTQGEPEESLLLVGFAKIVVEAVGLALSDALFFSLIVISVLAGGSLLLIRCCWPKESSPARSTTTLHQQDLVDGGFIIVDAV